MEPEKLLQTGADFRDASLHISVERGHDRKNVLTDYRFIMVVIVGPVRGA
jgi:hypothetical protein